MTRLSENNRIAGRRTLTTTRAMRTEERSRLIRANDTYFIVGGLRCPGGTKYRYLAPTQDCSRAALRFRPATEI